MITYKRPIIKLIIRFFSWMILLCFLSQDIALSQGGVALSSPANWNQVQSTLSSNFVDSIKLPHDLALLRSRSVAPGKEVIINIQDAHASLDAQKSISKIFQTLVTKYDMSLIGVEGSTGKIDTSIASSFPMKEVREVVAQKLLSETKINSSEFFKIISQNEVELFGIEDQELYESNAKSYQQLLKEEKRIYTELKGLKRASQLLESKIFGSEIIQFNAQQAAHQEGQLEFTAYWDTLQTLLKKTSVGYVGRSNLKKLIQTVELETQIQFEAANQQRQLLMQDLKSNLDKRDLEAMVKMSLEFKEGKVSPGGFHSYIIELAKKAKLSPDHYADLILYAQYAVTYEDIDLIQVFGEINAVETEVRNRLFLTTAERDLNRMLNVVRILTHFLEAKLSSTDEQFYRDNIKLFDVGYIRDYFKEQMFNFSEDIDDYVDFEFIQRQIPKADQFYKQVKERNHALLKNMVKRMRQKKVKVAALVSGGFHTEGIATLMQQNRISHLVYMPKFGKEEGDRPYLTVITEKGSYLDRDLRREAQLETMALTVAVAMKKGLKFSDAKSMYIESFVEEKKSQGLKLDFDYHDEKIVAENIRNASHGLEFNITFPSKGLPSVQRSKMDLADFRRLRSLSQLERFQISQINAGVSKPSSKTSADQDQSKSEITTIIDSAYNDFVKQIKSRSRRQDWLKTKWKRDWEETYLNHFRKKGVRNIKTLNKETAKELNKHMQSIELKLEKRINAYIAKIDSTTIAITSILSLMGSVQSRFASDLVAAGSLILINKRGGSDVSLALAVSDLIISEVAVDKKPSKGALADILPIIARRRALLKGLLLPEDRSQPSTVVTNYSAKALLDEQILKTADSILKTSDLSLKSIDSEFKFLWAQAKGRLIKVLLRDYSKATKHRFFKAHAYMALADLVDVGDRVAHKPTVALAVIRQTSYVNAKSEIAYSGFEDGDDWQPVHEQALEKVIAVDRISRRDGKSDKLLYKDALEQVLQELVIGHKNELSAKRAKAKAKAEAESEAAAEELAREIIAATESDIQPSIITPAESEVSVLSTLRKGARSTFLNNQILVFSIGSTIANVFIWPSPLLDMAPRMTLALLLANLFRTKSILSTSFATSQPHLHINTFGDSVEDLESRLKQVVQGLAVSNFKRVDSKVVFYVDPGLNIDQALESLTPLADGLQIELISILNAAFASASFITQESDDAAAIFIDRSTVSIAQDIAAFIHARDEHDLGLLRRYLEDLSVERQIDILARTAPDISPISLEYLALKQLVTPGEQAQVTYDGETLLALPASQAVEQQYIVMTAEALRRQSIESLKVQRIIDRHVDSKTDINIVLKLTADERDELQGRIDVLENPIVIIVDKSIGSVSQLEREVPDNLAADGHARATSNNTVYVGVKDQELLDGFNGRALMVDHGESIKGQAAGFVLTEAKRYLLREDLSSLSTKELKKLGLVKHKALGNVYYYLGLLKPIDLSSVLSSERSRITSVRQSA
ncbi:MAG: hypothetical protein ACI9CF_001229 [Candidatus Omnitrophota bacterium]|jgi:hypothetical protein